MPDCATYAERPADLAEGRTIHELRTGDVARLRHGLYEIVGRRSRFAKVFGLRIDPQQVEAVLEVHGYSSSCRGEDDELVVVVEGEADQDDVRRLAAAACGLAEAAPGHTDSPRRRRRRRMLETGVALRAVAIVLIVGSHIQLFEIKGCAHLLLAVAGFNFARFHLTSAERRDRIRYLAQTVAKIAVPSMAWVSVALFVSADYHLENLFLLKSIVVPDDNGPGMHLWFVETVVYLLILAAVALCVPAFDRLEGRFSFGLPITIATIGLVTRYDLLELGARNSLPSIVTVFWLFALGWAAAKGTAAWRRVL